LFTDGRVGVEAAKAREFVALEVEGIGNLVPYYFDVPLQPKWPAQKEL
jgi:hypothetical protein